MTAVDQHASAYRFLDRIEAAAAAAMMCDPVRTVLLTQAEAAEFACAMEVVGGGVLRDAAGGEAALDRPVQSHLFALGLDCVSTYGDGRPLGVFRGVVLAERVAAEDLAAPEKVAEPSDDAVLAEGVQAVLLACAMLQRIGERLQRERAVAQVMRLRGPACG